jgi:hypothetical protein
MHRLRRNSSFARNELRTNKVANCERTFNPLTPIFAPSFPSIVADPPPRLVTYSRAKGETHACPSPKEIMTGDSGNQVLERSSSREELPTAILRQKYRDARKLAEEVNVRVNGTSRRERSIPYPVNDDRHLRCRRRRSLTLLEPSSANI